MKNWKTTLCGTLATASGYAAHLFPQYSEVLIPVAGAFAALFAFVSKDSNVTGGTIAQTVEAANRLDVNAK